MKGYLEQLGQPTESEDGRFSHGFLNGHVKVHQGADLVAQITGIQQALKHTQQLITETHTELLVTETHTAADY